MRNKTSNVSDKKPTIVSGHSARGGHYLKKKRHRKIIPILAVIFSFTLIVAFGWKLIKEKSTGTPPITNDSSLEQLTDLTTEDSHSDLLNSDKDQNEPPKTEHLSMELGEMLTVDADVIVTEVMLGGNDTVNYLAVTPEIAQKVLFPHDSSNVKQTTVDSQVGNIVVNTEMGNQYHMYPGLFEFYGDGIADKETLGEMVLLMESWSAKHPGNSGEELSFMRKENAVEYGESILRDLGVSYDPVIVEAVGLSHDEILQWQKECMKDPYYNEFGNRKTLSALTDQMDSYYLTYTFSYEGIPVYGGKDEPEIPLLEYDNNVPFKATATLLVTAQGVKYMEFHEMYSLQTEGEKSHVIPVQNALELLKRKFDETIPSMKYCVTSAFLEYVPGKSGDDVVLRPYWCFVMDAEYFDETTGEMECLNSIATERFNAITGNDILYGG